MPEFTAEQQELIRKISLGEATLNDIPKRKRRGRPSKEDMLARQAMIEAALGYQAQVMGRTKVDNSTEERTEQRVQSPVEATKNSTPSDTTAQTTSIAAPSVPTHNEKAINQAPISLQDTLDNSVSHEQVDTEQIDSFQEEKHPSDVHKALPLNAFTPQKLEESAHTPSALATSTSPMEHLRRHRQHKSVEHPSSVSRTHTPSEQPESGDTEVAHETVVHAVAPEEKNSVQPQGIHARTSSRRDAQAASYNAGTQQQNQRFSKQQRKKARGQKSDVPTAPSVSREELMALKVGELRTRAQALGIETAHVKKKVLVEEIYQKTASSEGFSEVRGVLDIQPEGYAFIRTGNYMHGDNDAFVHMQIIRQYGLRPGDWIVGRVAPSKQNNKYPPLNKVLSVNDRNPEDIRTRPRFRDLTPVFPDERLTMENGKASTTGRAIDLVAPIGKGQRGLIVSPPKAGKTTILKRICQSITKNNPEVHLFCLLVDERPEEVTDMQRSIQGTVVASTFDMPAENHTTVAELVIDHAKRLVELGEDVVVVLDSITRLARAYNIAQPASGRILSGGVDSAALYPPKKFLGAARNIEHGGSLTILASALIDTGSKMDEVIFEEFKGTGNMELKLDRDLADRRIFPAIDPVSSGTRNEDLLIDKELQPLVWSLRRVLANMNNLERASSSLVKGLQETDDNKDFLIRFARRAQAMDYIDTSSKA